ncbi:hypothetical protein [Mesorhizobium caraganae]|uniref:hypothetical protein n=1 Tax=Mesorhizobium caraganae TaxID=483206 RepID=UPI00177C74BC|nr:hypothetical protein [Mesorhizobium caraganae]
MGKPIVNRINLKYGRLTVIARAENYRGNAQWVCRCECGSAKRVVALGNDLQQGKVKSCGCWNAERIATHGQSRTPTYRIWQQMIQRCENPKAQAYHHYGERGISVCPEWHSFKRFAADMGIRPKGYSIDRIDNDGNYQPDNCRWASTKQQLRNTRRNRIYEMHGRKQTIAEWAFDMGIKDSVLRSRLDVYGWPIEKALTQPVQSRRPRKTT